jgi:hypothetical protein
LAVAWDLRPFLVYPGAAILYPKGVAMVLLMLAMLMTPQDDAAATDALTKFEAGFQQKKDGPSRAALISDLARVHHEKVVSKLGSLLSNSDTQVRTAAAQALGSFTTAPAEIKKSAAHALGSGLTAGVNTREPDVMAAILAAIGNLQEDSSGPAIKPHFEDKDIKIAGAAVGAAGAIKSKGMIDPLIEFLRECEKQAKPPGNSSSSGTGKPVKVPKTSKGGGGGGGSGQPDPEAQKRDRAANLISPTISALAMATGQNYNTSDEWEKWWNKNRGTFTPSK